MHKGFKCLDISSGQVYISRDVIFDESVYPFHGCHPNAGAKLRAELVHLSPSLVNPDRGVTADDHVTNIAPERSNVFCGVSSEILEENLVSSASNNVVPAAHVAGT